MRQSSILFGSLVVLMSLSLALSATEPVKSKKKLLEKLRATLEASENESLQSPVVNIPTAEELDKAAEASANSTLEEASPSDNKVEVDSPSTDVVTNPYIVRLRNILKRVMELLGLRRRKDGRKARLLAMDNDLDRTPLYENEVRTTVGAMLGQRECVQKVACVSGTYLNGIKGKQLIFALLDVFSPTSWKETVTIAKRSAIFNENCPYKCLEK